jgi:hypothetical protein
MKQYSVSDETKKKSSPVFLKALIPTIDPFKLNKISGGLELSRNMSRNM